jgi:Major tropism determinant N-terminal domain
LSEQLQLRRNTAGNVATFTGAQGEVVVDTTNNRLIVQDGATAGGFAAAKLSEVIANTRTAVSDASYVALASDRTIAYTALTAARVVTLPAASAYPTGTRLTVVDETGNCSGVNTITLAASGSDTVDGVASAAINVAYGFAGIESNGSNAWTIVDQGFATALATVAAAPNGANIQFGVLETLVTLSGASVTASVSIPANCIVLAVGARVVTTITGATSYEVGVTGTLGQFGASLGLPAGSTNDGLIGPTAFYTATNLIVTSAGGSFTGGQVRLSIHYLNANPSAS